MAIHYFLFVMILAVVPAQGKLVVNTEAILNNWNHGNRAKYEDCSEIRKAGHFKSGVYTLWMLNKTEPFEIYCEHTVNGSYNVIQRRIDGNINFNQGWNTYEVGFGNPQGDYWLGLKAIYSLTQRGNNILTINLQDWHGNNQNVMYRHFTLLDNTYYGLSIAGFQGNIPDDMGFSGRMKFSTPDRPDQNNCAIHQQTGWWYNYCSYALLNGKYYIGGPYTPSAGFYDGIYWKDWEGYGYSLKFAQMTISNM